MSAQEEMLEFALFDLSGIVQPVVVPTLNVTFNPSPLVVKSGDTGDQLTVNVINTSSDNGDRQLCGSQLHAARGAHHHRM